MTANRRIFLNIIATYGRSLYALALGLFTARWALMALGVVDYGLMGVVGGCTAFVEFFNNLLANSISRFYGFYIGAAKNNHEEGLENCRKWFNTALFIHTSIPIVLIAIGYPIGVWAVQNFLVIPSDRIHDCIWVWRFACISCFVAMLSVPYQAMYYAKQEIAELTLYSVASTTMKAGFLYYMVTHPGIWLAKYALWGCVVYVLPQLIICYRAMICYSECKYVTAYLWDSVRIKEIAVYALSRLWPAISTMCNTQGQSILANKYLGPSANASMAISMTVASQSATLSAALTNAFNPAIVNLAGECNYAQMRKMAYMACRMSSMLLLIIVIPLALEIDEVMRLWLKTPPPLAGELCLLLIIVFFLEKLTDGHWMSILALGRIAKYSFVVGWGGIVALLFAWAFLGLGLGILSMGVALIIAKAYDVLIRIFYGRSLAGLSFWVWIKHVLIPIAFTAGFVSGVGFLSRFFMQPSLLRCIVTTILCELVLLPLTWAIVLTSDERAYLKKRIPVLKRLSFNVNQP